MDRTLRKELRQTIALARKSGQTLAGGEHQGFTAPTTLAARVVRRRLQAFGPDGQTQATEHRVVIETDSVGEQDLVWLDAADAPDESKARVARNIIRGIDERGNLDHVEFTV